MKIYPPQLKAGDAVAVVATANKVSLSDIKPGIKLLTSWGLKPIIGKTIGLSHHQFAGTDRERLEDLQAQLDNPAIKAIFMARGGYGTVRIVDQLDFTKFKESPKWIVGYSDVTALHAHLQYLGYAGLHAEMPAFITDKSEASKMSLKAALFGEPLSYDWSANTLNKKGITEGELIGGNMSILYSLCGSKTAVNPAGKILFMEDLGEYLYHIDRMMQNFKRNGWFEQIAGLILGGLNDMKDNAIPFGQTAEEIIASTVADYDFPIAFDCPAGHIYDNRTLIFGADAKLEVDSSGTRLTFKPEKAYL